MVVVGLVLLGVDVCASEGWVGVVAEGGVIWVPGRQCGGRRGCEGRRGGCVRRCVVGLGWTGGEAGKYCRSTKGWEVCGGEFVSI